MPMNIDISLKRLTLTGRNFATNSAHAMPTFIGMTSLYLNHSSNQAFQPTPVMPMNIGISLKRLTLAGRDFATTPTRGMPIFIGMTVARE